MTKVTLTYGNKVCILAYMDACAIFILTMFKTRIVSVCDDCVIITAVCFEGNVENFVMDRLSWDVLCASMPDCC